MLRLDPRLAVFRSASDTITIGAQASIAHLADTPATMRAVAALARGVLPRELDQLVGAPTARSLLAELGDALASDRAPVTVRMRGTVPLARHLQRAAREAGHAAGEAVVVPVAPWRLPVAERERLAAARTPHLPVTIGDAWVQVGPFDDGARPCSCDEAPSTLPSHLVPVPTVAARHGAIAAVLTGLARASAGTIEPGWAVRVAQRDGAISDATQACACRARRGTARAA